MASDSHGTKDPDDFFHLPGALALAVDWGALVLFHVAFLSTHGVSSSRASLRGLTLQEGSLDFLTAWRMDSKKVKPEAIRILTVYPQNWHSIPSTMFFVNASCKVSSDSRAGKMGSLSRRDGMCLLGGRNSW